MFALAPGIQPQQHEQQQPFQQELVDLRRVARLQRTAVRKHHAPGQIGAGKAAPQFAVDEVTHTACSQASGHAGRHKISHLQPGAFARMGKPQHGGNHAQQATVERHAALPHRKNLQRVGEVVAGLVEQAVPQPPANDHAHHAEEKNVLDILARPGAGAGDGGKGLVPQAARAQEHEQPKRHQIRDAVPVNGEGAQLQGNGVDVGVSQHGGRYCARKP